MRWRRVAISVVAVGLITTSLGAQELAENARLRQAQQAYRSLEYERAIVAATQALEVQGLSRHDRIIAHELLGFAYGALDSARQSVENFRDLIFLDPDREPDVLTVSPRITALYASALGQVLVVRRLRADSTSFIAGRGTLPILFELSRAARAIVRVVGTGYDEVIDSQLVAGIGRFDWRAVQDNGDPVPPGEYQIVVRAVEQGNEFAAPLHVIVFHDEVDTLPHLTNLPGYTEQPETEIPPRDWKPLGFAVLYAGISAGAAVALENSDLGISNREVLGVGGLALLTGFIMSIKKPEARPVEANIRYNQLLRDELARQNAETARRNAELRRQVMLTIVPTTVTETANH